VNSDTETDPSVLLTFSTVTMLITHAVDSRGSKAFSGISVCVCVCLSARSNQNGWNYNHQTCHRDSPSRVLAHQLRLELGLAWSVWVKMHSIECPVSSFSPDFHSGHHADSHLAFYAASCDYTVYMCALSHIGRSSFTPSHILDDSLSQRTSSSL